MNDKELEKKVADYVEVGKDNKNVDMAALMLNALQTEDQNKISSSTEHWAYLVSIGAPPLGLLFAAWFYFSDKDDAKNAALICVILTVVSVVVFAIIMKLLFSSAGVSVDQVQQINPADIQELYQ